MIDRKILIGVVLVIAIISGVFMINKSNPAVAEKEVGYDLINNDNSVVSAITSSCVKDGNLIIHISNPNNEKIQIIGLEGKKYKIKSDEVIIYDYKGEQFKLKIGSQSDVYEFGNWIKEGDKVYVDNSSWGKLEAYPHTIHSSGWVYFNVTVYKNFGDLDFLWGFNTTEVKPVKAEFYKPHFVNWTTNHSAFFYNVSSISITDEPCDYGNEYNSYKRKITYQVCSQWNETTWECEKYNTTSAVVCFDSYEQNGTNYTAFWHTKHSRIENWINVGKYFNHIEYNYGGMNRWYFIKNFEIEPNKTYTVRAYVKVPVTTEGTSGKYFFAVKRSAETLSEAISNGHFMVLDPWWNASWSRERAIHINNTGNSNALTDYQVMINITYDSDMNSNFSDIRVVNETSGETVPYWIENKSNGNWCKIWFNASYIPASSWCNDTYYLYYGNPSASSASDGDAVFEFFDDFVTDLSKWVVSSDIVIENNALKIPAANDNANYLNSAYTNAALNPQGTALEIKTKISGGTSNDFWNVGWRQDADTVYVSWHSYSTGRDYDLLIKGVDAGAWYGEVSGYNDVYAQDEWHRFSLRVRENTLKLVDVNNPANELSSTDAFFGQITSANVGLGRWADYGAFYVDYIFVRKYADPEPTASLGSEEQQDTDTTFTVTLPAGYTYAHFNLTGIAGGIAHDTSGNGNDGTIYGAKWVDGKFGKALSFDGVDDYVDCGNDSSLDIEASSGKLTYAVWVKPALNGIDYDDSNYIILQHERSQLYIDRINGDFCSYLGGSVLCSGVVPTAGNWYYIALTFDGSQKEIFVNGISKGTQSETLEDQTGKHFYVGTLPAASAFFNGTIDEVRIYNRALNETEIQNNYNGSITRNGLVGEWKFDYGPSSQQNVTPEGQSYNQPFYNITNTGNVNLTVKMKINATIPNVILKADTDNNPSGAKEINTTYATLCEDLPPNEYLNVWLWTDLSHAAEQETEKELTIDVSSIYGEFPYTFPITLG